MALSDLTEVEQAELDRVLRAAEIRSRIEFSIWQGLSQGESRAFAESLHATLNAPAISTLFLVDKFRGNLEIVTGAKVRARVPDDVVAGVAQRMSQDLAVGELLAALSRGMNEIADAAN